MRKYGWFISIVAAALTLAGCGGDQASSFAGQPASSSSTSTLSTVASIALVTNMPQIPSNGSTPATITAIAKNANNSIVSGVPVVFATNSGVIAPVATATGTDVTPGTTDTTGAAAASLSTPGDPTNRDITVTASVGNISAQVVVAVVGTSISLTGPASLIEGSTGTFNVSLTDSAGAGLTGYPVTVASANGNTLSAGSLTADSTGHATFTLTASKAGTDTVSAKALGLTASQSLSVSSQSFAFTAPSTGANIALNTGQALSVLWTNNGAPVAAQSVTFSTTRGLFSNNATTTTATTSSTGTATPLTVSSTTAGPAVITASGTGVTAQLQVNFVATVPSQIDIQASPDTVETSGQSTITAIVRDAQDNLVEGQTVDFQLTDKTGGSISVATAVTNSQGVAQTVYTATGTASASNGVTVTATIASNPAIQDTVTLTVGGQTVFLSLGTGSTITENAAKTQFSVPFVVQALDSAGNAVPSATVTLTIASLPPTLPGVPTPTAPDYTSPDAYAAYRKGYWFTGTDATSGAVCTITGWCQLVNAECLNEDTLGNGIYASSEDVNNNLKLDPGNVAVVTPGSVITDSTGTASVNVTYPEDHALWVQVLLTATSSVTGTQASTTSKFWLPMLASYITNVDQSPPGTISPNGINLNCHIAN
jgi:hypothetical protein